MNTWDNIKEIEILAVLSETAKLCVIFCNLKFRKMAFRAKIAKTWNSQMNRMNLPQLFPNRLTSRQNANTTDDIYSSQLLDIYLFECFICLQHNNLKT